MYEKNDVIHEVRVDVCMTAYRVGWMERVRINGGRMGGGGVTQEGKRGTDRSAHSVPKSSSACSQTLAHPFSALRPPPPFLPSRISLRPLPPTNCCTQPTFAL